MTLFKVEQKATLDFGVELVGQSEKVVHTAAYNL